MPLSKLNVDGLYPIALRALIPKLVAEFVTEQYPPLSHNIPFSKNSWKQLTSCAYASFINRHPVPPKLTIVNALATILLPCSGAVEATGFSTSACILGVFGVFTFEPSISPPLPPRNDIIEQFCT